MTYKLDQTFTPITETAGTLFSPGREVEISDKQEVGSGFILYPHKPLPFKGTIYARAVSGWANLNVVNVTLPVG